MAKWQKILLLAALAVFFIVMAIIIYNTFFRPIVGPPVAPPTAPPPTVEPELPPAAEVGAPRVVLPPEEIAPPVTPESITPPAVLPEGVSAVAKGGLTQITPLTEKRVYGATLANDGENLLYYDKDLAKFYRLFPDGQSSLISEKNFFNVEKIVWDNNKEKTILEYPDGSNVLFNFKTNQQITLPKHWQDFDFAPTGDRLASKSIGVDIENRWLVIANEDGSGARAIQELRDQSERVIVDWSPNGQMVAMYANADGRDRQKLYFIGQNNENFRLLVLPGFGFEEQWSPSGEQMLFSVYNEDSEYKPSLWISDINPDNTGSNRRPLNIDTWVSKCVFADEENIYCAVPRSLKKGSGFYPEENKALTADDFYKINLRSGVKTFLARSYNTDYAVEKIMLSEDKKYLYFTDYQNGRVHKLQLAE